MSESDHRYGRGLRKWQRIISLRDKKRYRNLHERWPQWREAAKLHGNLTFAGALQKIEDSGKKIDYQTLAALVAGHTDVKLSTALDICEVLDCSIEDFSRAMLQAWEITERRWKVDEAMREALEAK